MASTAAAAKTASDLLNTGIAAKDRRKVADHLAEALADSYTLLVKAHVYHWNVVGPLFLPLHELTEQHYNDLFEAADEIAERIRALGHVTPLSFSELEPKAKLTEESSSHTAAMMVEQLCEDHEAMARRIRPITSDAADISDFVTHDMLNGRLAFHEKAVWMLRAIVQ